MLGVNSSGADRFANFIETDRPTVLAATQELFDDGDELIWEAALHDNPLAAILGRDRSEGMARA
ncbi:MAG: hypothetical protein NVS3B20_00060 [Polyangiales bacterium]